MQQASYWPVYGHGIRREIVASFFAWNDAASFVSENRHNGEGEPTGFERRNLYIAPPRSKGNRAHVG